MTGRPAAGVGAGAALVLLAGVGVLVLRGSDTTTSYDESAAVSAFRDAAAAPTPSPSAAPSRAASPGAAAGPAAERTPSAAPAPAATPARAPAGARPGARAASASPAAGRRAVEPGVYRYATEGHEQVDALGGARHDYPATSTITYSRRGCGSEERWQPLEERVGVTVQCDGERGPELRETFQQREFFGQSQSERYTCDAGTLVVPADPQPGSTWSGRCRSDDSTVALAGRVVALEELDVAGTPVPVVRVRVVGTLSGSTRGRTDRELWLARADGLLVQAVGSTDTDADTDAGTVRYQETYRLELQSLTPRR